MMVTKGQGEDDNDWQYIIDDFDNDNDDDDDKENYEPFDLDENDDDNDDGLGDQLTEGQGEEDDCCHTAPSHGGGLGVAILLYCYTAILLHCYTATLPPPMEVAWGWLDNWQASENSLL